MTQVVLEPGHAVPPAGTRRRTTSEPAPALADVVARAGPGRVPPAVPGRARAGGARPGSADRRPLADGCGRRGAERRSHVARRGVHDVAGVAVDAADAGVRTAVRVRARPLPVPRTHAAAVVGDRAVRAAHRRGGRRLPAGWSGPTGCWGSTSRARCRRCCWPTCSSTPPSWCARSEWCSTSSTHGIEDAARVLGASRRRAFTSVTLPLVRPVGDRLGRDRVPLLLHLVRRGAGARRRTVAHPRGRDLPLDGLRPRPHHRCGAGAGAAGGRGGGAGRRRTVAARDALSRLGFAPSASVAQTSCDDGRSGSSSRSMAGAGTLLLLGPLLLLVGWFRAGPAGWTTAYWKALFTPTGSTAFVDPLHADRHLARRRRPSPTVIALVVGGAAVAVMARRGRGGLAERRSTRCCCCRWAPRRSRWVLGSSSRSTRPPLDLRDSWWLVPIAQALVAVPFVVRVLLPVVQSFDTRLLDSAAVLGASPGRARWDVDAAGGAAGRAWWPPASRSRCRSVSSVPRSSSRAATARRCRSRSRACSASPAS